MFYIFVFFITLILSYLVKRVVIKMGEQSKKDSISKVIIVYFAFFFIAAFRWNMGIDSYYGVGHYSVGYYWASQGINRFNYDIGFFKFFEMCSKNGMPIFWCYFIISLLYFIAVIWLVKEMELDLSWSVITFFGVDMLIFTFSAVRQTLAFTFILFAMGFYFDSRKRGYLYSLLMLIIATAIHSTSALYFVLFLVDYIVKIIYKKDLKKRNIRQLISLGALLSPLIYFIIKKILATSQYSNSTAILKFTPSYLVFYCILLYAGYRYRDIILKKNPKYSLLILSFIVLVILGLVSSAIYHMDRIFHLFTPIYFIFIPVLWESVPKGRHKTIIFTLMIFMMIWIVKGYFVPGNTDYEVFGKYRSVFENWEYYSRLGGDIR